MDPHFVDKFLASIYVGNLVTGSSNGETMYELYKKSSQQSAVARFHLREFNTNSDEHCHHTQMNESHLEEGGTLPRSSDSEVAAREGGEGLTHVQEDYSYVKTSLGVEVDKVQGVDKILGIECIVNCDSFQFNMREVDTIMEDSKPTKRSVVSTTAKFFDPFGIISLVTILFKVQYRSDAT